MHTLISASELKAELQDESLIILDSRFYLTDIEKGEKEYQKGHIPGAIFVDLHHDLASAETPLSGRHPLPNERDFSNYLQSIGIDAQSNVVIYDDMSGAIAARAWWMLSQNNIKARVLDGGLSTWLALGEALETQTRIPVTAARGLSIAFPWAIDEAAVLENIEAENFQLLDARANDRFEGQNETIDPIAGHIPGALNRPFVSNLNSDGGFLAPDELAQSFADFAIDSDLVHYCGSGVTACHNVLANIYAGGQQRSVYVGSWSQWSKRMIRLMSEQNTD